MPDDPKYVEGKEAAERFKEFTKKVISVPRSEIQKREAEWKNGAKERSHKRHR